MAIGGKDYCGDSLPRPQKELKTRSSRTIWESVQGLCRLILGLYRVSNFYILPGVWGAHNLPSTM